MSNGLLISNKNVDEIIRIFDAIDLSLDGYDEESCSKIRGKGVFTKVISVVNLLIEKGFKSNNISLSMDMKNDFKSNLATHASRV